MGIIYESILCISRPEVADKNPCWDEVLAAHTNPRYYNYQFTPPGTTIIIFENH